MVYSKFRFIGVVIFYKVEIVLLILLICCFIYNVGYFLNECCGFKRKLLCEC